MSSTFNSIEINILSYNNIRTLTNKHPVQHLDEVPFGNFDLSLCLVDEDYLAAEAAGNLRCYSVNVNGEWAGYITIIANEMLHHRSELQAVTDAFYIVPKHRGGGAFSELIQFVENDLRESGIRFFTVGLNPNMPNYAGMQGLMDRLMYQHTEYSVTKEL